MYQNHIFLFTDHNNIMVNHLIIFIQNRGMFNVSMSCFFFAEIKLELSGL